MEMIDAIKENTSPEQTIGNESPLVELKNCTMEFPGVRALDNVSFTLLPGECHGLVGEKGRCQEPNNGGFGFCHVESVDSPHLGNPLFRLVVVALCGSDGLLAGRKRPVLALAGLGGFDSLLHFHRVDQLGQKHGVLPLAVLGQFVRLVVIAGIGPPSKQCRILPRPMSTKLKESLALKTVGNRLWMFRADTAGQEAYPGTNRGENWRDGIRPIFRLGPALLAVVLLIRLITLSLYPLIDPTESRYAEMARKMLETGNWVTPQIGYGVPFWGKPPLAVWLNAINLGLFGINELADKRKKYDKLE